ncbi:hypothetical protein GCM10011371_23030 [Novosphingobium marinum]|uniref:Uncharacterized protein n=1 Tax=Novosphingobium marinum TaxID=1514948 RepID=A0A7Y9Y0F0_9SPHN|nr:hypothetical protein [Novosphingobium marinum]NYH96418.1 hypothetical protein [Novosphingobium marinum]GGC35067.1 hypothetical protein GCM10011371_23030 [Novosphingobium marinum]
MPTPSTKPKIAFTGNESWISPLITEAFREFKGAELYDNTDKFKKSVAFEKDLLKKGYMDPKTAPKFDKGPKSFDMTVNGRNGYFEVSAGGKTQRIPIGHIKTMEQLDAMLRKVIMAMRQMLTQVRNGPARFS